VLAVYAAQQTRDAAFVKSIRARAAKRLLTLARQQVVDQDFGRAAALARESLRVAKTREAARVLAEAERQS
jgi:hypothetical protein